MIQNLLESPQAQIAECHQADNPVLLAGSWTERTLCMGPGVLASQIRWLRSGHSVYDGGRALASEQANHKQTYGSVHSALSPVSHQSMLTRAQEVMLGATMQYPEGLSCTG